MSLTLEEAAKQNESITRRNKQIQQENKAWRQRLRTIDGKVQASFRGAKFLIIGSEMTVGRRNVVHQFITKDAPNVEDLGKDVDEITLNALVIQNAGNEFNYFGERDALRKALTKKGAGTLVTPFFKTMRVAVKGRVSISESFNEGGMARFRITFVQAGLNTQPQPALNPIKEMDKVVGDISEYSTIASNAGLLNKAFPTFDNPIPVQPIFDPALLEIPDPLIAGIIAEVTKKVNEVFEFVDSVESAARTVVNAIRDNPVTSFVNKVRSSILRVKGFASSVVNTALGFVNGVAKAIVDVVNLPNDLASIINHGISGFLSLVNMTDTAIFGDEDGESILKVGLLDSVRERALETSLGIVSGVPGINNKSKVTPAFSTFPIDTEAGTSGASGLVDRAVDSVIDSMVDLADNFALEETDRTTRNENIVYLGLRAVENYTKIVTLATVARIAVRKNYKSHNDATLFADKIIASMDRALSKIGSEVQDDTYTKYNITVDNSAFYDGLYKLMPVFRSVMNNIGADLATIEDFQAPNTVSSTLVTAYDKYEDVNRANEIFDRNRGTVTHQGFIPEGTVIGLLNE